MSTRGDIMAAIQADFEARIGGDDILVKMVRPYRVNVLADTTLAFPLILIADEGQEQSLTQDASEIRYVSEIYIVGDVRCDSAKSWQSELNDLAAGIKRIVAEQTTWGVLRARVTSMQFRTGEASKTYGVLAECSAKVEIIYTEPATPTIAQVTGDGDPWLNDLSNLLVSRLNGLPGISAVYTAHGVASLPLDSITIGFDSDPMEIIGAGTTVLIQHRAKFTVRVHTGYAGDTVDDNRTAQLLNVVANKLAGRYKLADEPVIEIGNNIEISNRREFAESATVGGEIAITLETVTEHVQE